jgi:hypothetical protein
VDYFASALIFGHNVIENVAYLIKIDLVSIQESLGSLSITENSGNWVG